MLQLTPKLKTKWIKALKSGKYEQGKNCLAMRDSKGIFYCCLGVLGEITDQLVKDPEIFSSICFGEDGSDVYLKNNFGKYCILTHAIQSKLGSMNDKGQSFNQIADYIKENIQPVS